MLDRLKFVCGAVQDRAVLTALSHFHIYNGRVQGTNGRMSIDAAIPELGAVNVTVPGDRFLSAIEAAGSEVTLTATDINVTITGGRFRARVPLLDSLTFPRVNPDPADWELDEPLLPTLKRLRPFVATDAANAWATSILFTDKSATATNNVCVVSEPCTMLAGTGIASISVPAWAIDEVIRLGNELTGFGVSENSITFYFGELWIKTQLIVAPWPIERMRTLFASMPKKMNKAPEGLLAAVEMIVPFCKEPKFPVVLFSSKGISTEDGDHFAAVEGFTLPEARFNADMLRLVLAQAEQLAFLEDHRTAFKFGPARGIIAGLRA